MFQKTHMTSPKLDLKHLLLLAFILAKFIIHYQLISPEYDLHRDEYLHLEQGNHLAFGYLSVPPVTSWISYVIQLLGGGVFWVKFFPALFGALTILVVWKAIESLGGGLFALCLGATAALFNVILRLNILFQPNSFEVLIWTTVYYLVIRYIQSEHPKWLYWSAIAFAFGFLNKYNISFMVIGLLPALLLTQWRSVLLKKHLYLAGLLALVLISPNLIWQYQHNFPVFYHMRLLAEHQLVNVDRFDFVKQQFVFFMGSLVVLLAGFASLGFYKPLRSFRVLLWALGFTLALFIFLKAKSYYAIGLYPIFLAFGAVYLESLLAKGKWRYLRPVVIAIPILTLIPIWKVVFPINSPEEIQKNIKPFKDMGLLRWEDGKDHTLPQDFADMLGWSELAAKVDLAMADVDLNTTLVLCDSYGQAGAINYYSALPDMQAVTTNADYIDWFPFEREWKDVILVVESAYDDDPDRTEERPLFDTVYVAGRIENEFAREFGTTIYILKSAKIDLKARIREEIEEERWD